MHSLSSGLVMKNITSVFKKLSGKCQDYFNLLKTASTEESMDVKEVGQGTLPLEKDCFPHL